MFSNSINKTTIAFLSLTVLFNSCATRQCSEKSASINDLSIEKVYKQSETDFLATLSSSDMLPQKKADLAFQRFSMQIGECYSINNNTKVLTISGGNEKGAFAAGFLNGWLTVPSGNKNSIPAMPEKFDIVTGVSTGALIAPFAFLAGTDEADEKYNKKELYKRLAGLYRDTPDDALAVPRFSLSIPFSSSLAKTDGLWKIIQDELDSEFIDKIGSEREKGRCLYVGVVNLDDGNFYSIDLTALAAKKEYDLFRKYIYASASMPVIFPPVEIQGSLYIDGAFRLWVFFENFNKAMNLHIRNQDTDAKPVIYTIINSDIGIPHECTQPNIFSIAKRTLPIMLDSLLLGSLYKISAQNSAEEFNADIKITYIPMDTYIDCSKDQVGLIDIDTRRCLYDYGYGVGADTQNVPWQDIPFRTGSK